MTQNHHAFAAVDDAYLARAVQGAKGRLVYAAPGLGKATAIALVEAMGRQQLGVTIILDADADACRIGYGDPEALRTLHAAATRLGHPLRRQAGLRIGLIVADDAVVIWSPTARSVESERVAEQPNGIVLSGPVVQVIEAAVGADGSNVLPLQAEIGRAALKLDELKETIADLAKNPPAPFDLARRTRVFSTRFQFVEFEIRGAEWTERRIKLSSLLLNADLPEALQDILETQVRPFQSNADVALEVPHLVKGTPAYKHDGTRMLVPATQADVMKAWADTRDRYLRQLRGFGWLIRRDQLEHFRAEIEAFEETLRAWVTAFREHVEKHQKALIANIVKAIKARIERSVNRAELERIDLGSRICDGLERMRVVEPEVRIVLKNVAWESSRDEAFISALKKAIPEDELKGWFEEFTAARERGKGPSI